MSNNTIYYPQSARHKPVSRLSKRQQQRMNRQTLVVLATSAILLLLFIFIILPGLLGYIFKNDSTTSVSSGDTIPPQVPILAAPPLATNSAQLTVSGFSEAGSEVVLVVNGEVASEQQVAEDGSFALQSVLRDGENTVAAFARDDSKNESRPSKSYLVILDTAAPGLELESPQPGQQFELRQNQNINIKGKTEPNARVQLNERLVLANSEGEFSTTIQLNEGENKLLFKIIDEAGNSYEEERVVSFRF